jgi:hypothetical protein
LGRKPKNLTTTNSTNPSEDNRPDLVDEKTVWDFMEFARSLSSMTGMPLTPDLLNSRLRDVTLLNVGGVTEDQVYKAMSNPKENEDQLLQISESLEISSTPYKRILQYMSNLLSFDLTYYCKNAEYKDYKSPKYQKDLDVVKLFLDSFDYKKEFSTVIKQLLREEAFFSVLRDEGDKYVLQQLPSNYCKISGRFDHGILFSYNYQWFLQGGVDINLYPPIFKKTFNKLFTGADIKQYNPSLSLDLRGDSTYVYWADCSPVDNFWAWKMSPEIITRIPYFAGMFQDISMTNLVRGLQKNNYMATAVKFILGEVALLKDTKATLKDSISISPELLAKFMQLIKSAINSEVVRIASAPLTNMSGVQFEGNMDVYNSFLKTTLGSSGVNSNLLFSADVKPNLLETQLSANVDELVMANLYPSFNSFIEYHVNRKTKNFKFGFNFEGSNFYTDRERRFETQLQLLDKGIVNPGKLAASLGQNPFAFQAQLDEARAMGWVDNLTPILSSFQMSGKETSGGAGGRPTKKDSELSESGSQTREDGGNIAKGTGKV